MKGLWFMFRKLSRAIVSITAIVASVTLAINGVASAAPAGPSVTITMQQLDMRVGRLPGLYGLKAGDQVTITDDGSVTGAIWSGTYAYYPAGNIAPFAPGYARWKDGLVALTPATPPAPGQTHYASLDANYIQGDPSLDISAQFHNPHLPKVNINVQKIQTLVPDGNDPGILRIPDNAWLFRRNSDGSYTTLVSLFVFVSGTTPVWPFAGNVATGSQPVPVSVGFWQIK
jgi:hypothetical protein